MFYRQRAVNFALAFLLTLAAVAQEPSGNSSPWRRLDTGLELGSFKVTPSESGISTITILRVDPQFWKLKLLCASEEKDSTGYTPRGWCEKYGLAAAINAGMYNMDYTSHTGFLKCGSHLNNPKSNQYKSAAAFGPKRAGLPLFRIFDLEDITIDQLAKDYEYVTQNLRLIKRPGENRWEEQDKKWSEAALGEDAMGRALLIFCRSPYSMAEFNRILLSLPIDLVCAQHLEGGLPAQLFVNWEGYRQNSLGIFEPGRSEHTWSLNEGVLPNVIGVLKPDSGAQND